MSEKHLGFGFDVHCGRHGPRVPAPRERDRAERGRPPGRGAVRRTWIHNGFVNVDKEKMAKSLGNFVTIRDVYERNDPEALRYFLLSVHYRGPIAFDTVKLDDGRVVFPGVVEAERRVDYLYQTLSRASELRTPRASSHEHHAARARRRSSRAFASSRTRHCRASSPRSTTISTPRSRSACSPTSPRPPTSCATQRKKDPSIARNAPYVAGRLAKALVDITARLGLLQASGDVYTARTQAQRLALRGLTAEAIDQKIKDRADARASKDFARADALRTELTALAVEVFDSPTGTTWRLLA
jgi:cysteinyl-tRNA synthetase